jgi:hypothetical protein
MAANDSGDVGFFSRVAPTFHERRGFPDVRVLCGSMTSPAPPPPPKPLWQQPIFIVLAGVLLLGIFLVLAAIILRSGNESASGATTTTSIEDSTTTLRSTTTSKSVTTTLATTTTPASTTTTQVPSDAVVEFNGSGKSVKPAPQLTNEQFVLEVTIDGGTVKLTDSAGTPIQVPWLWSTWPGYEGETLIPDPPAVEFVDVDPKNSSPWKVIIRPLTVDDVVAVPGTITGSSDDVVYVDGAGEATIVDVDGVCERYGIVTISAYAQNGERLAWSVFNWDEGDLPGEMLMPDSVVLLAVTGEPCSWAIEWP